jgi:hypothetical protein
MSNIFTIVVHRRGNEKDVSGTIPELIEYFGYTLEVGQSWQHEKGNKTINRNPETIEELVKNLNNAKKVQVHLDTILEELQTLDEADRGIDVEELLVPLKHVLDILQSDEKGGNHYE